MACIALHCSSTVALHSEDESGGTGWLRLARPFIFVPVAPPSRRRNRNGRIPLQLIAGGCLFEETTAGANQRFVCICVIPASIFPNGVSSRKCPGAPTQPDIMSPAAIAMMRILFISLNSSCYDRGNYHRRSVPKSARERSQLDEHALSDNWSTEFSSV